MEQLTLTGVTVCFANISSYRAHTPDTDPAVAELAFVRRYGQRPAEIVVRRGLLLVGPVPEVK